MKFLSREPTQWIIATLLGSISRSRSQNFAGSRTSCVDHTLKFYAGKYVWQPSVAILRDAMRVECVVTGSQNHIPNLEYLRISSCWLKSIALAGHKIWQALHLPFWKVSAICTIDHGIFRYGLREGAISSFALAQPNIKNIINHFLGTFFFAYRTAGAYIFVHIAGFLSHGNLEITQVALHCFDFAVGKQGNIWDADPLQPCAGLKYTPHSPAWGNVLSHCAMCPPMDGWRSTR